MARLQILNLPGDGNPFAVIIDQADDTITEADIDWPTVAGRFGARAALVFQGTVDIPANDDGQSTNTVDGGTVSVKVIPDLSAFAPAVEAAIDDANRRIARARTGLKADQEQYCPLCPSAPLLTADAMATHMRKLHPLVPGF